MSIVIKRSMKNNLGNDQVIEHADITTVKGLNNRYFCTVDPAKDTVYVDGEDCENTELCDALKEITKKFFETAGLSLELNAIGDNEYAFRINPCDVTAKILSGKLALSTDLRDALHHCNNNDDALNR